MERRGIWLTIGAVIVLIVVLFASFVMGGGDDDDNNNNKATSTTTTSTTLAATTTTAAPVPVDPGAPTTCLVGQLTATLTALDAAAGNRYANLVFTNTSPVACTMFGFPGMQLLANGGSAQLPTLVERNEGAVPKNMLTLAAGGGQAFTRLHWSVVSALDEPQDAQCQPTPDNVQITPPDEGDYLTTPWTLGFVCDGGTIDVNAVQPGAGP